MVAVPGFPRPLYPPDATPGHTPSVDGPDVEAYKRTVWRAGRWPGPASGFDRTFSNGFSHGKGGDVVETGIAGVQRQQNVDDTGWIGEKTFNTLRSIRVPQGPHEGEMAMDANAANLIAQAWQLYGGKEPEPEPPSLLAKTREKALSAAIDDIGYVETGNNDTKYGEWYGANYQPYCAMACTYWYEHEAGGSPSFVRGQNYAYVPYMLADAGSQRNGLSLTESPDAGCLVIFDWGYDGTYDHVGLFEKWVSTTSFQSVEANTSPDDGGSQSNGGGVYRRTRNTLNQSTLFIRVAEP
jgi:hypothetical protein